MRRVRLILAAMMAAALIAAVPGGTIAVSPKTAVSGGAATDMPTVDTASALVELQGAPLATYVKTKPAPGKKVDFNSATVKSYRAELSAVRNSFKQWLHAAAPKAQVVGSFDIALNAVAVRLNGTPLATIQASPLVVRAEYEGLYYPTTDPVVDPDLAAISATEGWANAGTSAAEAGTGVKVGVIDTGIDINNPCFSDAGYDAIPQLGQTTYTNNKVFVARVFNNKLPQNGFDAAPVQEHGTHVAGTIACNAGTPAAVNGVVIPQGVTGVAPHALLGNYNIFPGDVINARSEDILNALDAAYADGMDIVNMSLGGGQKGIQDLLTVAVDNLDQADMISAVAAGNSGPGFSTVESPGSAARALTAGASTVNHTVASYLTAGDDAAVPAVAGAFGTPSAYPFAGTLRVLAGTGVSGLSTACAALPAAASVDSIALVQRGTCSFSTKVRSAQQAGYAAAVVVNNIPGPAIPMGQDRTADQPAIPAWMVSIDTASGLQAQDGQAASVSEPTYVYPFGTVDTMADFSSQGPTNVDFRVKPDVVAPGVNVLSSIPNSYCGTDATSCFAFFQGTSMATPHLAGVAAIIVQQHPDWPAWEIRSAVVNTADADVLTKSDYTGTSEQNVNIVGAGRVNLASATEASALLDPVSISFGATPSGSGVTKSYAVRITNGSDAQATYSLAIAVNGPDPVGVTFDVDTPSVTLAAGASATFHVTAAFAKSAPVGGNQAWLTVSVNNSMVAHAAVYALVK